MPAQRQCVARDAVVAGEAVKVGEPDSGRAEATVEEEEVR